MKAAEIPDPEVEARRPQTLKLHIGSGPGLLQACVNLDVTILAWIQCAPSSGPQEDYCYMATDCGAGLLCCRLHADFAFTALLTNCRRSMCGDPLPRLPTAP